VVVLLLLVSAGGWWVQRIPIGWQQTQTELNATAQQDRWPAISRDPLSDTQPTTSGQDILVLDERSLRAALKAEERYAPFELALQPMAVHDDQAVVRIVASAMNGVPAYRQTRFYRRMADRWQPTVPKADLWGQERRLETPSFVFHFRQNDASAVIAVSPQIDALNTTLRDNFGLPLTPGAEKLIIEVSVTQPPGQTAPWFVALDRFIVPSPAIYWAPVKLTDAQLLAQSIAFPLLAQVLAQARDHHQVGPAWQPMLSGLYLWQVWDQNLPLAAWREEVVKWVYLDLPAIRPEQSILLPEHYSELCAEHKLWLPSPTQLNLPLLCTNMDLESYYFSLWDSPTPLTRLDQLSITVRPDEYLAQSSDVQPVYHPGHTVALATLIEYAVTTYGRDRLPALVAGLGQYESWETLLPAGFGISADEFEAGWQAYLAARYGVSQ
jgi:hypothetical protein